MYDRAIVLSSQTSTNYTEVALPEWLEQFIDQITKLSSQSDEKKKNEESEKKMNEETEKTRNKEKNE